MARKFLAAGILAWAFCAQSILPLAAAAPAADAAQTAKVSERDRLWKQAQQLRAAGKTADAIAACEKMVAIERELVPRPHDDLAMVLDWMGEGELELDRFAQAEKRFQEALDARTAVHGAGHWQVTDARLRVERARLLAKLSPQDRQDLRDAEQANTTMHRLYRERQYRAGIELGEKSRLIRLRLLGQSHPYYAVSLINLASLYEGITDYARAEPLYRQAAEIRKQALGQSHPDYARTLNNLASLYDNMGDYARAEPLYRQAIEIRKNVLGQSHPDYAASLNNLALLYKSMGDYARAEPLYRQAIEIDEKALPESNLGYATSLNNLAALYDKMGDYARAEPLYRQAAEIRKKVLGQSHPDYAISLNNLAVLYRSMGDYVRAEPLLRQAAEIHKKALSQSHPDYATNLDNLAALYDDMGNYARAESLYRQTIEIRKKAFGQSHPEYAQSLNNLAFLYMNKGDYAQAEPLCREAMEIRKKVLGQSHPDYAISLNNLAVLYRSMGDYVRAEPLSRQAATMTLKSLQQSFLGESQRQQLAHAASVRFVLDSYLMLEAQHGTDGQRVYPFWLQWKGLVLRQQWRQHALVDRPELKPTFAELEQVTSQLARLALTVPTAEKRDATQRQLAELSARKEQLERKLAQQSAAFVAAARAPTVDELQQALPAEAALVDFVEYWQRFEPGKKGGKAVWKRQLAAFVVRRDGPIRLVSLGESGPVNEAIDRWRGKTDGDFGRSSEAQAAGKFLRERVWQPVETLLAGAGVVKLVLVSPDGPLGRLPFDALPGKEPDHYLLEDWPLAVIPSPAALAQPALKPATPPVGNLLVVADVDYNLQPGAGASQPPGPPSNEFAQFDRGLARDAGQDPWPPLDGTLGELAMLERLYQDSKFDPARIKTLSKADATTAALCRAATGHRYLHLATHGFFASPKFRSALEQHLDAPRGGTDKLVTSQTVSGYHPGLLSGLVLAGANHPQPQGDNGYLTAEEVGTLDLRSVQLAVLSACETGLGNVAGGEGLLGLQRAFQAAGARTVVASFWKVPDQATRLLMERFYKNLWQAAPNQPRMTKLEALREAQLWMLREGASRGLAPEENSPNAAKRLPPYFWAAFVLSGDWK